MIEHQRLERDSPGAAAGGLPLKRRLNIAQICKNWDEKDSRKIEAYPLWIW